MPPTLERLTTERVPQKWWVPIAVAILAICVVGVLVVKPWGADPGRPVAASAAAAPVSPAADPTASPAGTVRLLPTPDIAPLGPVGDFVVDFVSDVAMAQCHYGRMRRGLRHLEGIEVQPPTVLVDYSDADIENIRSVGWSFRLERNTQETVFNRDWETVARSRRQTTAAVDDQPTAFTPMSLMYDARDDDETAVFRARVIVEWLTRNFSVEFVLTTYLEGDQVFHESGSALCAGARTIPG